jgi:hypothetical protein
MCPYFGKKPKAFPSVKGLGLFATLNSLSIPKIPATNQKVALIKTPRTMTKMPMTP